MPSISGLNNNIIKAAERIEDNTTAIKARIVYPTTEVGETVNRTLTAGSTFKVLYIGTSGQPLARTLTLPASMPASDVSAWAKSSTKPTYTATEVGAVSNRDIENISGYKTFIDGASFLGSPSGIKTTGVSGLTPAGDSFDDLFLNYGGNEDYTRKVRLGGVSDAAIAVRKDMLDSAISTEALARATKDTEIAKDLATETTRAKQAEQAAATSASTAQTTANSKYSKPVAGIPKTDLVPAVQSSLALADGALQPVHVVNNLTSTATNLPLSAAMGKLLNELAKGKSRSYVIQSVADLATINSSTLLVGDIALIIDMNVPDRWWDGTTWQLMETTKIDLSDYVARSELSDMATKTWVNAQLALYMPLTTKYAKSLEVSGCTVTLKDQAGTVLSTITTQDTNTTYSAMTAAEGQTATATSDRVLKSTDLKSIILHHSPAGSRTPIGTAGGDLTGSYPNPTLAGVTRSNTADTASPALGGTFQAIGEITSDTKGRVTGVTTRTVTLPAVAIGNGTVTITQNGTSKGSFTLNQAGNVSIALTDTDTNTTYTPSSTVAALTSGGAGTAGTSASYSRGDHIHTLPAYPTLSSLGAAASSHTHANTDLTGIASWAKAAAKPSYTASEVGLSAVANERQYSAANPPNFIRGRDTRSTNSTPYDYMQTFPGTMSFSTEFKSCDVIGVNSVISGMHCYLMTTTPWGDSSGGYPVQIATANTSNGMIAIRSGTSNTTWGAWHTIHTTSNPQPIKTINGQSLQGTGNITISASDINDGSVS